MNYSAIIPLDIANGVGWRTTLFVSGCNFHCQGCFNQEAQSFDYGEPFTMFTLKNILDMVNNDKVAGLSILGGDPMCQDCRGLITLISLCKRVRHLDKTVWIWSGFTFEQIFSIDNNYDEDPHWKYRQELIENVDVLVDGPYIESQRDITLPFRGSKNQRIIDVKKTLQQNEVVLLDI